MKLSETEQTRLLHAPNKRKALRKMGYTDDIDALLWTFVVEERLFPLDNHAVNHLIAHAQTRPAAEQMRFFQALADTEWNVYTYKRQQYINKYIEETIKHNPDALKAHYTSLPTAYMGWVAVALVFFEKIDTIDPVALPAVARYYLAEGQPWYYWHGFKNGLESHVDEALWRRACLDLAQEEFIKWEKAPPALLDNATDEELIRLGVLQNHVAVEILEEVVRRGKRLLPMLAETYADLDLSETPLPGPNLFFGWVRLLHQEGLALPPALAHWARDELRRYGRVQEVEHLQEAMQLLPIEQARSLLANAPLEYQSLSRVFPKLQDEEVITTVLRRLQEDDDGEWNPSHYIEGFGATGPLAVPPIVAILEDKNTSVQLATTLTHALVKMGAPPESQVILGALLHHSSKKVREAAAAGLALQGDDAMSIIQEGLFASKKPIRSAALFALGETAPSPARDALLDTVVAESKHKEIIAAVTRLPRVANATEGVADNSLQHQTKTLFDNYDYDLKTKRNNVWRSRYMWNDQKISEEALAEGGVTDLVALAPTGQLEVWRPALARYVDDPLAAWLAVYQVSQQEWLYTRCTTEDLQDALQILGESLVEPLCAFSLYGYNAHILLPLLAELSPARALPVLLEGIDVTQSAGVYAQVKPVREASTMAIAMLGEAAVAPLSERLQARKKDQRLAAAEALARVASPTAVEALEAAFQREKVGTVQAAISKAIDASALASQTGGAGFGGMDDPEIEAYLSNVHFVPLPDFLDLRALPPLTLRSGHTLSADARWGWVSQLSHETPDNPNPIAHELRERFDRRSLSAFGTALAEQRLTTPPPNLRWLHQQRAVTASTTWLFQHTWIQQEKLSIFCNHGSRLSLLMLYYIGAMKDYYSTESREAFEELPAASKPDEAAQQAFQAEKEDAALPAYELDKEGKCAHQEDDATYHMCLAPTEPPTLGVPIGGFALRIDEESAYDEAQRVTGQLIAKKYEGLLNHTCQQMRERLANVQGTNNLWSQAGWHAIFAEHPLWSALARGFLFQDEEGHHFLCHPAGHPVDIEGEALTLEDDTFVGLIDVSSLDEETQAAWQAQLDEWHDNADISLAEAPEDPLFALRDLLYTPPSQEAWEALKIALESWPEDGTLAIALAYIDSHISAWGDLPRPVPEHWTWLLLDKTNPKRIQYNKTGGFQGDVAPLVQACNALHFEGCDLRPQDARKITSASLQHITHLSFRWGRLYKDADTHMAKHLELPALKHISLNHVSIRKLGWAQLFGAPWFQACSHMSLQGMQLDWQKLEELVASGAMANTTMLNLNDNAFGLPGVEVLLHAAPMPTLKGLTLSYTDIGAEGFRAFCASGHFEQLEELGLIAPREWHNEENTVNPLLTHAARFPNLKKLVIHEPHLNPIYTRSDWVQDILACPDFPEAVHQQFRALYQPAQSS